MPKKKTTAVSNSKNTAKATPISLVQAVEEASAQETAQEKKTAKTTKKPKKSAVLTPAKTTSTQKTKATTPAKKTTVAKVPPKVTTAAKTEAKASAKPLPKAKATPKVAPKATRLAKAKTPTAAPTENLLLPLEIPEESSTLSPQPPVQQLTHLRDAQRGISEQVLNLHSKLADMALSGQHQSVKALKMYEEIQTLQTQKSLIEKMIADLLQHIEKQQEEKTDEKSGLIRVRHANRDFFLADLFDYALKDDTASMEAPIFSLSTKPDLSIWEWRSKDGNKYIKVAPSVLGRATQHDKDILIYVISQLVEGLNQERNDAKQRTVRFTVYDFLVTANRQTSGQGYKLLHEAFERLRGTTISTDIKTGGTRVREGFGIIDRWKIVEKSPNEERMVAVEVTLSEWLYNAVKAFEVLSIHPDYFRLRKPLARRLYELARKHCGQQTHWRVHLTQLQEKAGSKSSLREFRRAVRSIQEENSLPDYTFMIDDDDMVTFCVRDPKKIVHAFFAKKPKS